MSVFSYKIIAPIIFLLVLFFTRGLAEGQGAAVNADPDFNNYTASPSGPWIAYKISNPGPSIWKTQPGGEGWPSGPSLWIYSDAQQFDGGVYQIVPVTAGKGYHFEVAWAVVRFNGGTGPQDHGRLIRQVGFDPFGGTNPLASTVKWSGEYGGSGKFAPSSSGDLQVDEYARNDRVTIFLRARNTYTDSRAEVFFDRAIMTENTGMPPISVAAPTAAAPAQKSPTATLRSAVTRVAQATPSIRPLGPTTTLAPNPTETDSPTPTPFPTRTPRPTATAAATENTNAAFLPAGIPLLIGGLVVGGMGALFLGYIVFHLLGRV